MSEFQAPKHDDYAQVLDRVLARVACQEALLEQERMAAPALLEELSRHPPARRRLLARNSRRFRSWILGQTLIQHSHRLGFSDPTESCNFAELATDVVQRLDVESYGSGAVEDIRASAWAQMANAHRILGDLRKSEEAFAIAEHFLQRGSGDPLEIARVADLKASLRRAQRRFEEGLELLDLAIGQYRAIGNQHFVGRTLIKKGATLGVAGQLEQAIETLQDGLLLIDAEADPRLALVGQHNLIGLLSDSGRHLEAQRMLAPLRRLHRKFQNPLSILRLLWLEGRIAFGLGRYGEAEAALEGAQKGFLDNKLGYNAAMVSLDLAALYAEQGRAREMRVLAAGMYPIFHAQDVHREALAALLVFRQAVEAEKASLELIREVRTFLDKAQDNPRLRFRAITRSL